MGSSGHVIAPCSIDKQLVSIGAQEQAIGCFLENSNLERMTQFCSKLLCAYTPHICDLLVTALTRHSENH